MRARQYKTFDVRAEGDAPTKIAGYASVFNQIAYGEVIRPGAFTKTLQEQRDIKAFWSHDTAKPIGRTINNTLSLRQDEHGLYVEITPNLDTTFGRDALESVKRGDVNQMSFGMEIINGSVERIDGEDIYVIREIKLYEVSPVSMPWYEGTSAAARERDEAQRGNAPGPVPDDHPTQRAKGLKYRIAELQLIERDSV